MGSMASTVQVFLFRHETHERGARCARMPCMAAAPRPPLRLVPNTRPANRRRLSRLDPLWQLHVEVVSCPVPATVREISTSGFSVETTIAFPRRGLNDFRFKLDEGRSV